MVKCNPCVHGEDFSAGIDLGSRAEDARQSVAAGTRAEAVLVHEGSKHARSVVRRIVPRVAQPDGVRHRKAMTE